MVWEPLSRRVWMTLPTWASSPTSWSDGKAYVMLILLLKLKTSEKNLTEGTNVALCS